MCPRARAKQRLERVVVGVGQRADLRFPRLADVGDDGERERLLVLELVVERPARVTRLGGDVGQHEVAVAVAGEPEGGGIEQRGACLGATVGL